MNNRLAVIVLSLCSMGWGLVWLPIKAFNGIGIPTAYVILIAYSVVALFLLPWIVRQRQQWLPNVFLALLICLFGGFASVAFQIAISEGDVIRITILFYMLPIWSVLGGKFILHERIDKRRITALILCVGGAFFILQAWKISWLSVTIIDWLAIGSGMALAANNIVFRFTPSIPVTSKVGFMFIGSVVLISAAFVFLPNAVSTNTDVDVMALLTSETAPLIILYGVGWIMLITLGSQWSIERLEAGRSSVIIVTELVVAIVSVVIITQSQLQAHEIIGSIMVFIAAILEGARESDNGPMKQQTVLN